MSRWDLYHFAPKEGAQWLGIDRELAGSLFYDTQSTSNAAAAAVAALRRLADGRLSRQAGMLSKDQMEAMVAEDTTSV